MGEKLKSEIFNKLGKFCWCDVEPMTSEFRTLGAFCLWTRNFYALQRSAPPTNYKNRSRNDVQIDLFYYLVRIAAIGDI